MPKKWRAFALRGFDEERILQCSYFQEFKFDSKSDIEILLSFDVMLTDSADDMETKQKKVKAIHSRLHEFRKLIKRHEIRINRFNRRKAEKLGVKVSKLQFGEGIPIGEYFMAELSIVELMTKFEKSYFELEKQIEERYRHDLALRIKKARNARGITQRQLGELVEVSPQSFSRYERGERDIPLHTMIRLAKVLNMSGDQILGLK